MNPSYWKDKRVLVTGGCGFKGHWLVLLLKRLGCNQVAVYDKDANQRYTRDYADVYSVDCSGISRRTYFYYDIVFHLAGQPIVSHSWSEMLTTYKDNLLSAVSVTDTALRGVVKTLFVATTDKVYKAEGHLTESSPLGFDSPYQLSKSSISLFLNMVRKNRDQFKNKDLKILEGRGGNVIGGGDFGEDRLIPDVWRAKRRGEPVLIRNPNHIRPWTYILDTLAGYIHQVEVGQVDVQNYGGHNKSVGELLSILDCAYPFEMTQGNQICKEDEFVYLDTDYAWTPKYSFEKSVYETARWYKEYDKGNDITEQQIEEYLNEGA